MSYQAVEAVMQRSKTVGTERLVLMVIATHADAETLTAYLGETTLCKEANMKERNLRYTLAKLKASGEIQCVIGGGRGYANVYTLTLPEVEAQSDKRGQSTAPLSDERGQRAAGFPSEKRGNLSSERGQSIAEKGQWVAPQPGEPERTTTTATAGARGAGDADGIPDPFASEAVALYVRTMQPSPGLSIRQAELIAGEVTDLGTWRNVVVMFAGNESRGRDGTGRSVGNALDRYRKEVDASRAKANEKPNAIVRGDFNRPNVSARTQRQNDNASALLRGAAQRVAAANGVRGGGEPVDS